MILPQQEKVSCDESISVCSCAKNHEKRHGAYRHGDNKDAAAVVHRPHLVGLRSFRLLFRERAAVCFLLSAAEQLWEFFLWD